MKSCTLKFNRISAIVYNYYWSEEGLDTEEEILPGFLNISRERLERMHRVSRSAAGVVMATMGNITGPVTAGEIWELRAGSTAEAFTHRYSQAPEGTSEESALTLMALNFHLDKGGFLHAANVPELRASVAEINRAFPSYGEAVQGATHLAVVH